jgi:hypothetical protein
MPSTRNFNHRALSASGIIAPVMSRNETSRSFGSAR